MLHRSQQLRIDPRQPGQSSRIEAIIFPSTFPDQTHVARMRHNHFVSQLAQHAPRLSVLSISEWQRIPTPSCRSAS
jgi:hypothetical protein